MVFRDMRTVLAAALVSYARPHDFTQSVNVVGLDAQTFFYLAAHVLRPRLRPERPDAQLQIVGRKPLLMQRLSQIQGIGRRTGNTRHSKVSQQTDMFLRIPGRSRQYGSPQMLHTVMGTQSARKQPVAISHGNDVSTRHAIGRQRTCYHFFPNLQVTISITYDGGIARRAGRGMDTDYLGHGRSQQAHRIIITQIRLGRKRQLHNVVYRTDIIRKQIHFLHLSPVERRVMIYQIHQLVQPFPL